MEDKKTGITTIVIQIHPNSAPDLNICSTSPTMANYQIQQPGTRFNTSKRYEWSKSRKRRPPKQKPFGTSTTTDCNRRQLTGTSTNTDWDRQQLTEASTITDWNTQQLIEPSLTTD